MELCACSETKASTNLNQLKRMFDLAQNVFEVSTVKKQPCGDANTHLQVVKPDLGKLNCGVHTSNPILATWEDIDTG